MRVEHRALEGIEEIQAGGEARVSNPPKRFDRSNVFELAERPNTDIEQPGGGDWTDVA